MQHLVTMLALCAPLAAQATTVYPRTFEHVFPNSVSSVDWLPDGSIERSVWLVLDDIQQPAIHGLRLSRPVVSDGADLELTIRISETTRTAYDIASNQPLSLHHDPLCVPTTVVPRSWVRFDAQDRRAQQPAELLSPLIGSTDLPFTMPFFVTQPGANIVVEIRFHAARNATGSNRYIQWLTLQMEGVDGSTPGYESMVSGSGCGLPSNIASASYMAFDLWNDRWTLWLSGDISGSGYDTIHVVGTVTASPLRLPTLVGVCPIVVSPMATVWMGQAPDIVATLPYSASIAGSEIAVQTIDVLGWSIPSVQPARVYQLQPIYHRVTALSSWAPAAMAWDGQPTEPASQFVPVVGVY